MAIVLPLAGLCRTTPDSRKRKTLQLATVDSDRRAGTGCGVLGRRETIVRRTGMTVSRIAFGTGQLGGIGGSSTSVPPSKRSGTRASSAPTCSAPRRPTGSGGSEEVLGTALRDEPTSDRDSLVIATKGGIDPGGGRSRDAGRAWLRQGIDESLRALRLDHVDLYRMHWPNPGTPTGEPAGALQELVDEGEVGTSGCPTTTPGSWPSPTASGRSRPCSRPTTGSGARSNWRSCPIPASTTSGCSPTAGVA